MHQVTTHSERSSVRDVVKQTVPPSPSKPTYRHSDMSRAIDKSFRLLGAKFLHKHAKRLTSQLDPASAGEDIEGVHQARVASRRLRAALNMFADCFPSGSVKRWRKAIRRITNGLGEARDHDVQIQFLADHLAQLNDARHTRGIATLLGDLERERAKCQPQVVKVVQRLRRSEALEDILQTTRSIRSRAKSKGIDVRSSLTIKRSQHCLTECLAELYDHADGLGDPSAAAEHHAMRIAAKHLRYTLEMVMPVFAGELDSSLVALKELQTLLGEIHDCDVWDTRIDQFEQEMRRRTVNHFGSEAPFQPLEAGLEDLRETCRQRRQDMFDQLCRCWADRPLAQLEASNNPHAQEWSARCGNERSICCKAR